MISSFPSYPIVAPDGLLDLEGSQIMNRFSFVLKVAESGSSVRLLYTLTTILIVCLIKFEALSAVPLGSGDREPGDMNSTISQQSP